MEALMASRDGWQSFGERQKGKQNVLHSVHREVFHPSIHLGVWHITK